jgi:RNA polymerase sigma-70 factor (ECF subfamily)
VEQPETDDRLSRIETQWTAVLRAHGQSIASANSARGHLLLRYSSAVYRYLLGAVRDPDVASDLCQDFAVRFLRGDFHRVAPERGRFRDYVKTALVNLANDHHRARQAGPRELAVDVAAQELPSEDDFIGNWRQSILDQTWKALSEENATFHAVLLLRIENPDMQSTEMAARLTAQLDKPMSPENVRKSLQRAHSKFAELMLDQVADSLHEATVEELESELKELDLLRYCRSALDQRRQKK